MGDDKNNSSTLIQQPGQHVIRREDMASEVKTPWQQIYRLAMCNVVIYAALTACALIIGPPSLAIGGAVLALLLVYLVYRVTWEPIPALAIGAIFLALAVVWLPNVAGGLWPERWTLDHWLVKAWLVCAVLFVLALPYALGSFRYSSETVDPNGPTAPRAAIPYPGVVWPGAAGAIWDRLQPPEGDEPQVQTVRHETRVEITEANGNMNIPTFGLELDQLVRVAAMLTNGSSLSERGLCGNGRALSGRGEFQAFRDTLIERGLACWKNAQAKQQGAELTAAGQGVMRRLAG